jgi:hypothetical protein
MLTNPDERCELDEQECRRLLAARRIGRLAFSHGAMPAVVPVTFAVRDDDVLIPARLDGFLAAGVRGAVVALEVDSYLDEPGAGWTVTVVGPVRVIRDPAAVAEIDNLGLFRLPRHVPRCYVAVRAGLFRGWRSGSGRPALDGAVSTTERVAALL